MVDFHLPPETRTRDGKLRDVGYELEYAGVDLKTSVAFLEELLGVEASREDPFRFSLEHPTLGTFTAEVDASLLHKTGYQEYLAAIGVDLKALELEQKLNDLIESVASMIVPCEIVSPPLPIDDMMLMNDIAIGLRERKARGTGHSFLYAFGVHINPLVVSMEADYLLNHMRAFALLYDWICRESRVDFTRRMGPHIKPYPAAYVKTILDPDYRPDLNTLMEDYLNLVGSRNHALDMLPLLATVDEERVKALAKEPELIKPRPTFHYRLPNSQVDLESWHIADEWNYWVKIEALAHDQKRLLQLCRDYLDKNQASMFKSTGSWVEHVNKVLA